MYQNEKLDNRVKFTRECVFEAFSKLLKQKSFDSITINEIVELSGISRATFYRNYKSKEDIIEKRLSQIIRESFTSKFNEYKDIDVSNEDALNIMIKIMYENDSLLECIKLANMDSFILNELTNILKWYANYYYNEMVVETIEFDYIVGLVSASLWNTFSTWIDRDKKETPEELFKILLSFFTEVSRALVEKN